MTEDIVPKGPGPPRGGQVFLSAFLWESILYGAFVWARRARKHQKRRFPARAEAQDGLKAEVPRSP
jgi:hypothetical protein